MKTPVTLDYAPVVRRGLLHDHVMRDLQVLQRVVGFQRATLHYDRLLLDDLAAWMERQDLKSQGLAEPVVARFLTHHMRTRRSRLRAKRRTLGRFLTMLRKDGIVACPPDVRDQRNEPWVERFARRLREDRGCPKTTMAN